MILLHIEENGTSLSRYLIDCMCKVDCGKIPEHRTEDEIDDLIEKCYFLEKSNTELKEANQEFNRIFDSTQEENHQLFLKINSKDDECNDLKKSLDSATKLLAETGVKYEYKDGLFVLLPNQPKKSITRKSKPKIETKPKPIAEEKKTLAKAAPKKVESKLSDPVVRDHYFEKADKVLPLAKTLLKNEKSLRNVADRVAIYKKILDYSTKERDIQIGDKVMEEQLVELGNLIKQLQERES